MADKCTESEAPSTVTTSSASVVIEPGPSPSIVKSVPTVQQPHFMDNDISILFEDDTDCDSDDCVDFQEEECITNLVMSFCSESN
ncbi:hypothetical protein DPMN_085828 [Dreissena polymorpha]|uniref:Uncharacterized protein n=1 Tax=Dreissena polymorpha TaxID=45954 RepID=A0A9D3YGS4_DREPO|nr:hypothetical protein DPMN_085828 [Dreissena polymorpha]